FLLGLHRSPDGHMEKRLICRLTILRENNCNGDISRVLGSGLAAGTLNWFAPKKNSAKMCKIHNLRYMHCLEKRLPKPNGPLTIEERPSRLDQRNLSVRFCNSRGDLKEEECRLTIRQVD